MYAYLSGKSGILSSTFAWGVEFFFPLWEKYVHIFNTVKRFYVRIIWNGGIYFRPKSFQNYTALQLFL